MQRISWLIEGKQETKRGRKPTITFLLPFLIYLCILAIRELCSWVSWIVTLSCGNNTQDPHYFRHCKKSQHTELLRKSFHSPKRTDRRESNTGAMGSHWDTSHSQSLGSELAVADTVFEITHGRRNKTSFMPQTGKILSLYATLVLIFIYWHIHFSFLALNICQSV